MATRRVLLRVFQRRQSVLHNSFVHRDVSALRVPLPNIGILHHRYTTKASQSRADSNLLQVLRSEIEHENQKEASKREALKGSCGPFELSDTPGTEEVVLTRTYGNEKITVTCVVENQYRDAEDECDDAQGSEVEESADEGQEKAEGRPLEILQMLVNIQKEDASSAALEFECSFVRGDSELVIDNIAFSSSSKEEQQQDNSDTKPQQYQGPQFRDLDENLQEGFYDLLKSRGLSPKVSTYVLDYLIDKEQIEYKRWLQNVESFFKS